MKKYEKPFIKIENFEISDIITVSTSLDDIIDKNTNTVNETINFDELNV